ncbi:MAG: relaxase, partial [Flavobacterium sp.]
GKSIHMLLRKSGEGQLYGITYVDHKTKSVFNGSSLGKEFSAKGIQENCTLNMLALERKHQNSISTTSENFQNLELKEYVKENLADILLRGEKVNDYVSKQFKQKKKKRLYKGI